MSCNDEIIINQNTTQNTVVVQDNPINQSVTVNSSGSLVFSVNGMVGAVVITPSTIGLGNVDNTSDLNKPLSYAAISALLLKTDLTAFNVLNNLVTSQYLSWENVYFTVNSLSSNWNSSYNWVNSNSSNATFNTVSALSLSGVFYGDGSHLIGASLPNQVTINSIVTANSANWNSVYSDVNSLSSNWNSVYSDVNSLSSNWQTAYNISTSYQLASGSFATNSLLQKTSALLTPLTLTNNLTSQLLTNTVFNIYQTNVATSTATLLPTSVYQNTSGLYVTNTSINSLTGNWNSVYSNVNNLSSNWNSVYSTYNQASASFIPLYTNFQNQSANNLSVYSTFNQQSANNISVYNTVSSISGNWNTGYAYGTVFSKNSSSYATIVFTEKNFLPLSGGFINGQTVFLSSSQIYGNLTIFGNLTSTGTQTFANTIFSTTSTLSVVNYGVGPALFVEQVPGPLGFYDIASFYTTVSGGLEIMHIGSVNPFTGIGKVGINTGNPNVELTVVGSISATGSFQTNGAVNAYTANFTNPSDAPTTNFLPLNVIGSSQQSVYTQLQNTYAGLSASTDLSIYNDANNYLDLGIASSQYNGNIYSPAFNVVLANDVYAYNANAGNFDIGTAGAGDLVVFTGGTLSGTSAFGGNERLRVKSTGNVGINVSNPSQQLSVGGSISASGVVYDKIGNSNQWNNVYNYVNSNSAVDNPKYNVSTFAKLSSQVYIFGNSTNSIVPVFGSNTASGCYSNVAGGYNNNASGCYSNVAGGAYNTASGNYSTIIGGSSNSDFGNSNVFILGSNICATQGNTTFVNNIISPTYCGINTSYLGGGGGGAGQLTMNGGIGTGNYNGSAGSINLNGGTANNGVAGNGGSILMYGAGTNPSDNATSGSGGSICLYGGLVHGTQTYSGYAANGGNVISIGGTVSDSNTSCNASGGTLNMSGGTNVPGGSVNTSAGGGCINTTGSGYIGLGNCYTNQQTKLQGTVTSGYNQTLCFPDTGGAGGTIVVGNNTLTTFTNPVTASGSFLIINVNGTNKAIQLWNYSS